MTVSQAALQWSLAVLAGAALAGSVFCFVFESRLAAAAAWHRLFSKQAYHEIEDTPTSPDVVPHTWPSQGHASALNGRGGSVPRIASAGYIQARLNSWCDALSPKYPR